MSTPHAATCNREIMRHADDSAAYLSEPCTCGAVDRPAPRVTPPPREAIHPAQEMEDWDSPFGAALFNLYTEYLPLGDQLYSKRAAVVRRMLAAMRAPNPMADLQRVQEENHRLRAALEGLLKHCGDRGWWLESHAVKVMDTARAALAADPAQETP